MLRTISSARSVTVLKPLRTTSRARGTSTSRLRMIPSSRKALSVMRCMISKNCPTTRPGSRPFPGGYAFMVLNMLDSVP